MGKLASDFSRICRTSVPALPISSRDIPLDIQVGKKEVVASFYERIRSLGALRELPEDREPVIGRAFSRSPSVRALDSLEMKSDASEKAEEAVPARSDSFNLSRH